MTTIDTLERRINRDNLETSYTADDFVNPESLDQRNARGSEKQRAWVLLDGGHCIAIVFSEYYGYCEQDALDEAVDAGKLDAFQVTESELADYVVGHDSEGNPEYEGIVNAGNASEPFAFESLDIWTVPARLFADDDSLMTHDRVMARLLERTESAEAHYNTVATDSPEWSRAYQATVDADDAMTLARLIGHGRGKR